MWVVWAFALLVLRKDNDVSLADGPCHAFYVRCRVSWTTWALEPVSFLFAPFLSTAMSVFVRSRGTTPSTTDILWGYTLQVCYLIEFLKSHTHTKCLSIFLQNCALETAKISSALFTQLSIYSTPKKNTSHGNEVLPQNTTHLKQRPCYQRGSPCQDPAGNWTTWRSPDDLKETQTAVVWSCFPFIRSGQNHLERGEEDKADKGRGGKTTSGNGQAWSSPSPRGQWKTVKNGGHWLRNHLWCPNDPRG